MRCLHQTVALSLTLPTSRVAAADRVAILLVTIHSASWHCIASLMENERSQGCQEQNFAAGKKWKTRCSFLYALHYTIAGEEQQRAAYLQYCDQRCCATALKN